MEAVNLKEVLHRTLDKILNGDISAEQVEQVCYVSEQYIKHEKNAIEVEKVRLEMDITRHERIEVATQTLIGTINEVL